MPENIEAQAEACWQNIIAILADAGMDVEDLVKITTFLVRPEDVADSIASSRAVKIAAARESLPDNVTSVRPAPAS